MEKKRIITIQSSALHVREAEDGGTRSREVEGHAVVFGQRSVNLTPWHPMREVYEIMEPGSIDQALIDRSDVVLTCFHDNSRILGRSVNGKGTLSLSIDETGLLIRCELPKTATGDEMLELIERGDICGMSFAYTCDEDDTENGVSYERTQETGADGREVWIRHVKKVKGLYDVTIAGHPAYKGTDIAPAEREAIDKEFDFALREEETEKPEGEEPEEPEGAEGEEPQENECGDDEKEREAKIAAQVASLRELTKYNV